MIRYILLLICLHHAISFAPFHHLEKNTLSTGLSSTSNQRPAAHHLQAVVNGNDNHNDNVKNINDAKQKKTTSSSYLGYDSDDETKSSRTKKRVAAVAAVASQVNGYAERSDYERQKRRRPRRRDDTDVADSIINGSGNTAILSIDDDDVDCIDGTNVARASAAAADDDNDETCTIENGDFQVLVEELAESIDLDREQTRMDSFSSYILVTCLTATASFATVKGQGVIDGLDWPTMLIHYGAVAISTIAALSGTYATVIFSMTSIYGRTSLGMRRDGVYDYFMRITGDLRLKAFQAYTLSLGLFVAEMVLVSSEHMVESIRYPFLLATGAFASYMIKDWKEMQDRATAIFTNVIPPSDKEDVYDEVEDVISAVVPTTTTTLTKAAVNAENQLS